MLEGIQIDPETSVKEIVKFREKHKDELGRFRTEIAELNKATSSEMPLEAFYQRLEDINTNQVQPAINSLKKALKIDSKIKWSAENFLKPSVQ